MKGLLLEIYFKNIKNICIMNAFLISVWILINFFADVQMIIFAYFAVVIVAFVMVKIGMIFLDN